MPRLALGLALVGALAASPAGAGVWGAPAPVVSWLTVEANEGGSSGGHTALRLDDEVFHFQHEGEGWLRLRRDRLAAFHHQYALLGNRSVEEARVAVTPETRDLLRDGFVRRLLASDAWFEAGEARARDVAWLEGLSGGDPAPAVALPALGFFLPDGAGPAAAPGASRALADLRARIARDRGASFLGDRAAALAAAARALELPGRAPPPPPLEPDRIPVLPPAVSDRHRSLETGRLALALLDVAPALRDDASPAVADPALALRAGEADALRAAAAGLADDLSALVASPRDDFGPALALGLARLAAIEASLARGRLVLLDAFPDGAPTRRLEGDAGKRQLAWLERETRVAFARARARALAGRPFEEAAWSAFESAASRWLDARRAQETGAPVRLARGVLVPSRAARRSDLVTPRASAGELAGALVAARAAATAQRAALDARYPYALLSRNCATELFATVEVALAEAPEVRGRAPGVSRDAAVEAASRARLGGYVDGRRGLAFVPAASAGAVEGAYTVTERATWPSWRELRLAEMRRDEPALLVSLRESNTWSATIYERDPADSRFLFFAEDASFARPLAGVLNFAYGLGQGAIGIVTLPFEGPERLSSGFRGALFSLPELAFWSLRKGALAYVDTASLGEDADAAR